MGKHIIIDGYNLIRQSPELYELDRLDLELGRNRLIDMLAVYKRMKAHKITVVFDGGNAPPFSDRRDKIKGIHICFSGPGETADAVIKKMTAKIREHAFVVSSDREIIQYAEKKGAVSLTSPEFSHIVIQAAYMEQKGVVSEDEEEYEGWIATTKKKGPSRRLSRKKRRKKQALKKL